MKEKEGVLFSAEEMNSIEKSNLWNQQQGTVKCLGMEFESDGEGGVNYLGLSLFHTQNAAYTGNILATEEEKREMISRYISVDRLNVVKEKICTVLGALYKDRYKGPFGIDMMIVRGSENGQWSMANGQFLLHPCVELNLRRTMGHVALNITPSDDDHRKVMRIELTDHYKLSIRLLR